MDRLTKPPHCFREAGTCHYHKLFQFVKSCITSKVCCGTC